MFHFISVRWHPSLFLGIFVFHFFLSSFQSKLLLPEFDNGFLHKYIIICDQRYGGTWLTTLLREQINYHANDAIIHLEGELYRKVDMTKMNLCQRIMNEFFNSSKCFGRNICAFRMPYFVWQSCNFLPIAIKEQIHFLHILRENKIDWLLSHAVANELRSNMKKLNITPAQVMHCKENEKCYAEDVGKVTLPPAVSIQMMREQTALDLNISISLQNSNLRYRSLLYEDIVMTGTSLILDFLGINVTETNQNATTKFKKRITKPQKEVIENYGPFVRAVKKTEFRWYLDYCIQSIGKPEHC